LLVTTAGAPNPPIFTAAPHQDGQSWKNKGQDAAIKKHPNPERLLQHGEPCPATYAEGYPRCQRQSGYRGEGHDEEHVGMGTKHESIDCCKKAGRGVAVTVPTSKPSQFIQDLDSFFGLKMSVIFILRMEFGSLPLDVAPIPKSVERQVGKTHCEPGPRHRLDI
jgi:hypothetical protein